MTAGAAAPRAPARPGRLLALVTALCALSQFASALYLPSLPAIRADLATTDALVQATLTTFLVGFAFAQLVHGPLSDRLGRRPVILAGVSLYVGASVVCALAPSIEWLMVARVLQGVGACAGLVVGRAVVRDLYDGPQLMRAMAVITTAVAIVPGFAPLLGGVLQDGLGWRAAFGMIAGGGTVVVLLVWRGLPETHGAHAPAPAGALLRTYAHIVTSRALRLHGGTTALAYAALFAWMAGSPALFIDELGVSATVYGAYPMVIVAGYFAGGFLAGWIASRAGRGRLSALGAFTMLGAALGLFALCAGGTLSAPLVAAVMTVFCVGLGIVLPIGNTGALEPFPDCAGTAAAVLGFVQMLGGAVGAAAVGALAGLGVAALPIALVIFAAAAALWPALVTLPALSRA